MPDAKIKWKAGERERIAKEVKRFNEKIAREAKKGTANLPPKMKTKDIISAIYSRKDFQAFQKLVENAFKPGAFAETKSGITKYENIENQIRTGIVNRARARQAEKIAGPNAKEMGTEYYNSLKPKKLKSLSNLKGNKEKYLQSLRRESSGNFEQQINETYIQNYLTVARKYIEYPYIGQIEKALKKIPADAFITAAETTEEFSIRFLYNHMSDTSLGYNVTRAFEGLVNSLGIKQKFQYDPMDLDNDIFNLDFMEDE